MAVLSRPRNWDGESSCGSTVRVCSTTTPALEEAVRFQVGDLWGNGIIIVDHTGRNKDISSPRRFRGVTVKSGACDRCEEYHSLNSAKELSLD